MTEPLVERTDERDRSASETAKTAAKVAASAVLATSLVGALSEPPDVELITLPEPVPIVQQYQAIDDDDYDDDERREDVKQSRWRRILRALKYLLVALALLASLLLGILKGCAGVSAGLLLPGDEEQQEQSVSHTTSTEDERGVSY